jgi:hypothetical protein
MLAIMRDIHRHVDAEDLERYSMGTSPPEEAALIEEHLLTCEACQDRLLEADEYQSVMRASSAHLRRTERTSKTTPKEREWRIPTWFPGLVAVACGIVLVVAMLHFVRPPGPAVAVSLTALRSDGAGNSAPSGRDLVLHPDLTGLAENSSYRLEIVDQTGHMVRQGMLGRTQNGIRVAGLGAGLYFVRVYLPAGELLREYGLRIQ